MKYFFLILLVAALLWIASIAWANRRKHPCDNRDSGGDGSSGDSGKSCYSSSCNDSGCGGGDGGGGY
jgi:hypothetical protein